MGSYEPIMTDLHSHFIPFIDDGADSAEESLRMVRGLMSYGYKKIITTPHIYHDLFNNNRLKIEEGLQLLKSLLEQHQIPMEVNAAAEYFFDEQFFRLIKERDLLTFGKNYVLFELPFHIRPTMLEDIIFQLNLAGYQPVLAHPERYSYYHDRKMKEYERLKNAGVLFQLNIMSLSGLYGNAARLAAHELIVSGMIEFAGSDLHRAKQLPYLEKAIHEPDFISLLASGHLRNNQL